MCASDEDKESEMTLSQPTVVILRTTRWAALVSVLGAVATRYLLDSVVARGSSLDVFAEYAVVMTIGVLLGSVAPLGLPELGVKYVAQYIAEGEHKLLRYYLGLSLSAAAGVGLLLSLLCACIIGWAGEFQFDRFLALCMVAPSVAVLMTRRAQSLQLGGSNLVLFAPALSTGLTVTLLAAAMILDPILNLVGVGAAVAVGNLLIALAVCRTGSSNFAEGPGRAMSMADALGWIRSGSHAVSNAVASVALTQGDIVAVGVLLGGVEAGAYAAASRLALVVTLALGGLIPREGPILGKLVASGDRRGAWQHYKQASRLSGLAGAALCALLIFGGRRLLEIFVPGSGDAAAWLAILALGRLAAAFAGPAAELLIALGAQARAAASSWIGVAVAGPLMVAFSVMGNLTAVAVSATAGMVARSALHYWYARRHCYAGAGKVAGP